MYPIGHFAFAVALRKKEKGWLFLALCCFLTILPDFDCALGLPFKNIGLYHRMFTHSILFAIGVGGILSRFKALHGQGFYLSMMVLSHSLLDMLCHDEPRNGVQLLWPLRDYFIFPFHPFFATPVMQSIGIEIFILINVYVLRETWDAFRNFIFD